MGWELEEGGQQARAPVMRSAGIGDRLCSTGTVATTPVGGTRKLL